MAVNIDGGASADSPNWDSLKPAAAVPEANADSAAPDWDSLKPASEPPKESSGIFRRAVGDPLVTAAKSVVGTGQAAVGLADIPTLGKAGKALASAGVDFPRTQQILEEAYSPEQQEANRRVRDAQGFTDTLGQYVENPSVIAHDIGQSVGPMLLGQGIGGAAMKAVPAISRGAAGALGEGAVTAGSSEEQIREQTPGGETSLGQTALAAGSGALTGAITGGSNVLAKKLGVGDVNTLFIPGAEDVAKQGLANKAKAVGTEAALEAGQETVQSGQEQAATNLATGKEATEGLGNAMAAGAVTGGGMGLGGGILSQAGRAPVAPPPAPVVAPEPVQEEQPKTNFEAVTENLKAQVGPVKGIATKVASMAVDAGITPEQQAAQIADTQPVNPIDGLPEEPSGEVGGPPENTDLNQEATDQSVTPSLDPAAVSMARNALNTVQASLDKGGVMGTVPPVLRNAAKAVGVYDPTMAPDQLLESVAQRLAENDTAPAEQLIENDFDFDESIPFYFEERTPRPTAAEQAIARDAAAHDTYHAEDEQDEDAYLEREREIRRQEAAQQAPAPVAETPVPAPVVETPAPQAAAAAEYKPQTLKEFEAENPDLKGSRVRNRWAGSVHDAWNAGVAVPENVIEELKAVAPNFLPDAIATDEVLLDRLQPKITNNLENEIDRVSDAKAKKAKDIDRKIKKQKLGMTESVTVLKDDYAELYRLKDTLDSLTAELHGRKTQAKNDGLYARDIVGKYRQYKLDEHQSKNQQQEPENGESENPTPEATKTEETVAGKEKYIPTNSIVEAAAVTEAAKRGLTDEQIKAGEYQRGFTKFDGLDIAIENGVGTTRHGVSEDGKRWSQQMKSHYGEIGVRDENGNLKTGADGDLVDVFVNPQAKETPGAARIYFVIDQINPKTGAFDEHKVMAGYPTIAAARKGYLENYEDGWQGIGAITPMKSDAFKAWLQTEDATKPVSDKVGAPAATENVKPEADKGKAPETEDLGYKYLTATPEDFVNLLRKGETPALAYDEIENVINTYQPTFTGAQNANGESLSLMPEAKQGFSYVAKQKALRNLKAAQNTIVEEAKAKKSALQAKRQEEAAEKRKQEIADQEAEREANKQKADTKEGAYYVTAHLDGKTIVAAGPFINDHQAALDMVDAARNAATDAGDPKAAFAAWGTSRLDLGENLPQGKLNAALGIKPEQKTPTEKQDQSIDLNLEAAKTLLLRAVPDGDLMKLYGDRNIDLRVALFRALSGDPKMPKTKAKSITDLVNLFYDKAGIPMDTLAGRNAKFKDWTQGRFTPSTYVEENLNPYVAETRAQRDKDFAKANDATIDFDERVRNVDDLLAAGKPVDAYFLALKTKIPLYFNTEDDGTVTMQSGGLLTNSLRASDGRQAIQNHKNREAAFRKQHGIAERKSAAKVAYEKENVKPTEDKGKAAGLDRLLQGEISVAEYGTALGLTEDEIDDALIGKFSTKPNTPYSDLITAVRTEIEARKQAIKKPTKGAGSAKKAYSETIGKWNAALDTLAAAEREYANPFSTQVKASRNYATLPSLLERMFGAKFENVVTGDAARKESYRADAKRKAAALDKAAAEKGPQFSRPDEMTSIFEKLLPESSTSEKMQARQAMAAHPEAARMQYVEDNFYDLLLELEQTGKVDIKC